MIRTPHVRNPYNYDVDKASTESGLDCTDDPGFTQQQFAEEADINTIVRRFGLTGEIPGDFQAPMSGDFTGVMNFQDAMNAVTEAREEFMKLPGELRYRFANDPQRLLDFVSDAANKDEALKLGILKPPPEVTRTEEIKQ